MRGLVVAVVLASAGCSLFLLDGLNEDDKPAADSGVDTGSGSSGNAGDGSITNDALAPSDATTDGADAPSDDPYGDLVRQDAPIGWWRLDEAPGATDTKDSSGKGVTASWVNAGGISIDQPGAMKHGRAYVFDGASELLVGDVFDLPSPQKYTFEAWVKPNLPSGDTSYHGVFEKISFVPTPSNGRWFYYYLPTPRIGFEEWSPTENTLYAVENIALPQNRFTHVAVTFDGSLPRLYIDGVLKKTGTKNGDIGDNSLGFRWADGWIGALDELAIYDKPLDAARVKAHFDAAATTN